MSQEIAEKYLIFPFYSFEKINMFFERIKRKVKNATFEAFNNCEVAAVYQAGRNRTRCPWRGGLRYRSLL